MNERFFYTAGSNDATPYAVSQLTEQGCTFLPYPKPVVTHLLLPVPSLEKGNSIRGGGNLQSILARLPEEVKIIGGNLPEIPGHTVYDLLKDPIYVAENAYITAHCAVRLAMEKMPKPLRGCSILVIGWGRIGKCLAALLKGLEANVTVAARKESDQAILHALGYGVCNTENMDTNPFRIIYNTVPVMLLPNVPNNCLKIDLASEPGIGGSDVIHARGLPGKEAPEASGDLIARTILRLLDKEEQL